MVNWNHGGLAIASYHAGVWRSAVASDFVPSLVPSLFRLSLSAAPTAVQALLPLLSTDEHQRAAAFYSPDDRNKYITSRGGLRVVLATVLGAEAREIAFEYGQHGKPALAVPWNAGGIHFNVSHSGEFALIVVSKGTRVGVDVEFERTDVELEKLARRFFSDSDCERLLTLPEAEWMRAFYRCWTRKEAYIKAVGIGLSIGLSSFDVSLEEGHPAQLMATRPEAEEAKRWEMADIVMEKDYSAAMCWEKRDKRMNMQVFP